MDVAIQFVLSANADEVKGVSGVLPCRGHVYLLFKYSYKNQQIITSFLFSSVFQISIKSITENVYGETDREMDLIFMGFSLWCYSVPLSRFNFF